VLDDLAHYLPAPFAGDGGLMKLQETWENTE